MKWVCPHCKTALETPGLGQSTNTPGPQPGWAYARCFGCREFALVELATAYAAPISREQPSPQTGTPKTATPPPFKGPKPAPIQSGETINGLVISKELPFASAFPLDPPAPETKIGTSWRALGIAAFAGASTIALISGVAGWIGSPQPPQAAPSVAKNTATTPSPQLERAHAAAAKLSTQAKPLAPARLASNSEIAPNTVVNDAIRSSAMAPMRPKPDEILYLQARKSVRAMELRTGPGAGYPLFGLADLDERYPVVEWKDHWFRIQLEETPGLTAWVSYDRAELYSQDKNEEDNR